MDNYNSDSENIRILSEIEHSADLLLQEGKHNKAIKEYIQALQLCMTFFDDTTNVRNRFFTDILNRCSTASLDLITSASLADALSFLKQLEQAAFLTGNPRDFAKEKCDIYNNMAVAFRHGGKLKIAKMYLEKALNIGVMFPDLQVDTAATNLNLCCVLSFMGKHKSALQHAQACIDIVTQEIQVLKSNGTDYDQQADILGLAYQNWGSEEDALGHHEAAIELYSMAINFLEEQDWSSKENTIENCRRLLKAATKKSKAQQKKQSSSQTGLCKGQYYYMKAPYKYPGTGDIPAKKKGPQPVQRRIKKRKSPERRTFYSTQQPFDTRFPAEKRPLTFAEMQVVMHVKNQREFGSETEEEGTEMREMASYDSDETNGRSSSRRFRSQSRSSKKLHEVEAKSKDSRSSAQLISPYKKPVTLQESAEADIKSLLESQESEIKNPLDLAEAEFSTLPYEAEITTPPYEVEITTPPYEVEITTPSPEAEITTPPVEVEITKTPYQAENITPLLDILAQAEANRDFWNRCGLKFETKALRVPRMLPCGHEYCTSCLINSPNFICNICKEQFHIKKIEDFPVSQFSTAIAEENEASSSESDATSIMVKEKIMSAEVNILGEEGEIYVSKINDTVRIDIELFDEQMTPAPWELLLEKYNTFDIGNVYFDQHRVKLHALPHILFWGERVIVGKACEVSVALNRDTEFYLTYMISDQEPYVIRIADFANRLSCKQYEFADYIRKSLKRLKLTSSNKITIGKFPDRLLTETPLQEQLAQERLEKLSPIHKAMDQAKQHNQFSSIQQRGLALQCVINCIEKRIDLTKAFCEFKGLKQKQMARDESRKFIINCLHNYYRKYRNSTVQNVQNGLQLLYESRIQREIMANWSVRYVMKCVSKYLIRFQQIHYIRKWGNGLRNKKVAKQMRLISDVTWQVKKLRTFVSKNFRCDYIQNTFQPMIQFMKNADELRQQSATTINSIARVILARARCRQIRKDQKWRIKSILIGLFLRQKMLKEQSNMIKTRNSAARSIQALIRRFLHKCRLMNGLRNFNSKFNLILRTGKVFQSRYYILSAYSFQSSTLLELYNVDSEKWFTMMSQISDPDKISKNVQLFRGNIAYKDAELGRLYLGVTQKQGATWHIYTTEENVDIFAKGKQCIYGKERIDAFCEDDIFASIMSVYKIDERYLIKTLTNQFTSPNLTSFIQNPPHNLLNLEVTTTDIFTRKFESGALTCSQINIENKAHELLFQYKNLKYRVDLNKAERQFGLDGIEFSLFLAGFIGKHLYVDENQLLLDSEDIIGIVKAVQKLARGFITRSRIRNGIIKLPNADLGAIKYIELAGATYLCRGFTNPLRVKASRENEHFMLELKGIETEETLRNFFLNDIFPRLTIERKHGTKFLTLLPPPKTPRSTTSTAKPDISRSRTPSKDIPNSELVLKTGAKINGEFFIVSVFSHVMGIRAEASRKGQMVALELDHPEVEGQKDLDVYCQEIIHKLRMNEDGTKLTLGETPRSPDLLYQNSQYICGHMFVVSVFSDDCGMRIQAQEANRREYLECTVKRQSRVDQSMVSYEDLEQLTSNLRIESVLGEDCLFISA